MTLRLCVILAALIGVVSGLAGVSGCTGDSGSSAEPTVSPARELTAAPTARTTELPTPKPTSAPTAEPTSAPTAGPTATPTARPTAAPTPEPTAPSTPVLTATPAPEPATALTPKPTVSTTPIPRSRGDAERLSILITVPCSFFDGLVHGGVEWSPDGSKILFNGSLEHDHPPAYVVEADGSRLEGIKGIEEVPGDQMSGYDEPLRTFDVSADGSKIAYSTCEYDGSSDENYEIVVSNIDGTGVKKRRLYPTTAQNLYPVWSPDGTRVALTRALPPLTGRRWVLTIHTVATGGWIDVRISKADVFQGYPPDGFPSVAMHPPAWSPDGRSIAFLGDIAVVPGGSERPLVEGTKLHVYTVGPDGSGLKRIVSNAASAPSWSPDGERMAVAVSEGDGVALYTFAWDGSDPVMVTSIDSKDMIDRRDLESDPAAFWVPNVSWSPDGSKIMYGALSVVNVEDGSVVLDTQLIRFEWVGSYGSRFVNYEDAGAFPLAAWSPDGSRIAMLAPVRPARQSGYAELDQGYPVLYTMNSDGTDPRILVGRRKASGQPGPCPCAHRPTSRRAPGSFRTRGRIQGWLRTAGRCWG